MKQHRLVSALAMAAALLAACGGGGGDSSSPPPAPPIQGPPPPSPPPPPTACSVKDRQNWVSGQMNEWYLFPETLPADLTPTQATVEEYLNHLTATARAQGRDRFFTSATSLTQDQAYYSSGASAGFGMRLIVESTATPRLFIAEAYEGGPALQAGIDRGTEILAIGTNASNMQTVSSIIAAEGNAGIVNALGPSEQGLSRVLRISDAGGTREVTITKFNFEVAPVSSRYGSRIIDDGGKKVGYLNFRTFISSADPALRSAFAEFKAAGVTEYVIDLRYNGGGLVAIAKLIGDLLGGNRSPSDVFFRYVPRPGKPVKTEMFALQPQSVAPTRVAFIGTKGTASSSEILINGFIPYLGDKMALIGTNTFGKPVGQNWIDRPQCDDRLKVTAFAFVNSAGKSDYFSGLADAVPISCQAGDELARPLGDPQEASIRQALDFLAGRTCTKISTGISAMSVKAKPPELLMPERPTTVQQESPGTF